MEFEVLVGGIHRGAIQPVGREWIDDKMAISLGSFEARLGKKVKLPLFVEKIFPQDGLLLTAPPVCTPAAAQSRPINAKKNRPDRRPAYLLTVEYPAGSPRATHREADPAKIRLQTNHPHAHKDFRVSGVFLGLLSYPSHGPRRIERKRRMSRFHRHAGGAAVLLACVVLAFTVLRVRVRWRNRGPLEKPGAAETKPSDSVQQKPVTQAEEGHRQAAEKGSESASVASSPGEAPAGAPAVDTTGARGHLGSNELFDGWEAPAVVLMLTGELHGYIEPCGCSVNQLGGLSRRADLLRQIDERKWPVAAFDVGGLVNHPNRRQGKFKFDMIQKCLVDMRYAGVAMGIEELQLGFEFLSFHQPEKLPLLSRPTWCSSKIRNLRAAPGFPASESSRSERSKSE